MKFSTRHDTDIPAESLFAAVSDFYRIERMMLRRGVSVERVDHLVQPSVGNAWNLSFDLRGKPRTLAFAVSECEPPEKLVLLGRSDQFDLAITMTVVALSPTKSRLIFEADVQPRGMKARLTLQTAKLGKGQLDRKFALRIAEYVSDITSDRFA